MEKGKPTAHRDGNPPANGYHPEIYRLYMAGYDNVYQKDHESLAHLLKADTPLKLQAALLGEVHARFDRKPLEPDELLTHLHTSSERQQT